MQGDQGRKPKHRAEPKCVCDPDRSDCHPNPLTECINRKSEPDCNCDPLTDGYANIDCNTHGIPIQPGKGSMGRRQ